MECFIASASKIAMVVILVIMVIVFLYDLLKPECDDLDYTTIPQIAMDLSVNNNAPEKNGLLRYDLIRNPDGKADLNAYEGKQWNALYSTQNTDAGRPIRIESGKDPFIVQKNNAENPAGYKAVKNFDEIFAANLNANVREDDAPQIYLFYSAAGEDADASEAEDSGAAQAENTPEAFDPNEQHNYIASLYLSCNDSETIAESQLTQKGFNVVDVNLSPDVRHPNKYGFNTVKQYTYLGYTVTTNPKAAVTDIRVAKIKSTSQAVMYGTVKYTAAGYDALNNSICYTKDTLAGSPILADDIQVANSLSEAKHGYEAVTYLGGRAYNFDACEDDEKWDLAKYVFFSPSEKYTYGQEYISGLYFVSGVNIKEDDYTLARYAEDLGGKMLGEYDLTKGREYYLKMETTESMSDPVNTYLCYTTTYNPKRALYDVQFYAGTPQMKNFVTTLTAYTGNNDSNYAQTGYGITSVFMQSEKSLLDRQVQTNPVEYKLNVDHYELNNYNDFTATTDTPVDPGKFDCSGNYVDNIIPGVKWKYTTNQPRMLYACGYKAGYSPLSPGDLVLSGSAEAPAGFASIQDVKSPFETKPLNLAYYYSENSGACSTVYLYINRAAPVRGKYIASIKVASYNPDAKWSDEERKANDTFSNDSCYISLVGSTTELINQNLSLLPSDAWYNRAGYDPFNKKLSIGTLDYSSRATYLGVTYTNNPSKAIHGLLRLQAVDGVKPSETITVNGAKYSLVESVTSKEPVPIYSQNMSQYYLYATTSSGGSSTGDAVSEIVISENIFEPDMSTVLTVYHGDKQAQKDFYGNVTQAAEYVLPTGDTNEVLYIHLRSDASLSGIDSFFVGTGDNEQEAMRDLLTQGATCVLPLNLNEGAGTNAHVYIGYHYYNPDYVNTKRTKYYMESAVKDLYVYVGEAPPEAPDDRRAQIHPLQRPQPELRHGWPADVSLSDNSSGE